VGDDFADRFSSNELPVGYSPDILAVSEELTIINRLTPISDSSKSLLRSRSNAITFTYNECYLMLYRPDVNNQSQPVLMEWSFSLKWFSKSVAGRPLQFNAQARNVLGQGSEHMNAITEGGNRRIATLLPYAKKATETNIKSGSLESFAQNPLPRINSYINRSMSLAGTHVELPLDSFVRQDLPRWYYEILSIKILHFSSTDGVTWFPIIYGAPSFAVKENSIECYETVKCSTMLETIAIFIQLFKYTTSSKGEYHAKTLIQYKYLRNSPSAVMMAIDDPNSSKINDVRLHMEGGPLLEQKYFFFKPACLESFLQGGPHTKYCLIHNTPKKPKPTVTRDIYHQRFSVTLESAAIR
ncbi:hypothetical protein C0J52_02018, partial [Blattella germanica]